MVALEIVRKVTDLNNYIVKYYNVNGITKYMHVVHRTVYLYIHGNIIEHETTRYNCVYNFYASSASFVYFYLRVNSPECIEKFK